MTPFLFLQIVYNLVTWGGLFVSAFMFANYYLSEEPTIVVYEKLVSTGNFGKGRRGTCEQPFIIINYNGQEKQLIYYYGIQVKLFRSVELKISKGFFGYDIARSSNFKTN